MTTISGTLKTYDIVGKKEDVEDIIYDISPTDTQAGRCGCERRG